MNPIHVQSSNGAQVCTTNITVDPSATVTVVANGPNSVADVSGATVGKGGRLTVLTNPTREQYEEARRRIELAEQRLLEKHARESM